MDDEEWDNERMYSADSDDSPLLSHRPCGSVEGYPPGREVRRRSAVSVLMKFFVFSAAMITVCVLLYIPVYNKADYHISKAFVAGWSKQTSRDTKLYVLPNNLTTVHEPTNICNNKLFLLIVVCSATENFDRRIAIRNSWGSSKHYAKLTKMFNIVRERYRDYNYTYDLVNDTRVKRELGIAGILPELAKALQNNLETKTEAIETEKRFEDDTLFQDFDMNKEMGEKTEDNYDYDNYQSNIMKIPPKGYEDESSDLEKVMSMLQQDKNYPKIRESLDESNTGVDFKVVFLLGLPVQKNDTTVQDKIEEEVATYGDIIQEGFIDSYNNLTLKSIMMLKYINNRCNDSVRYILKTDDDMYINVPNLASNLRNRSRIHDATHRANEYLLIGDLICGARPVSDATNKWYSPRYMYNGRLYPRYLSGTGYVLSLHAAAALYAAALHTPYFHLEDVYITGMCSMRSTPRIPPRDDPSFSYTAAADTCAAHARVTAHRITAPAMAALVTSLMDEATVDRCERVRLTQVRRDRIRRKQRKTKHAHVH